MYTINGLTPIIGSRGKYTLKAPWEIDPNLIYRCERVSSLTDFKLTMEIDILKEIYIDKGLTELDYQYAIKNNIKIITLKSGSKHRIDVPDNYMMSFPDQGFVPYQQSIISVNLGLLPEDISLATTVEEIKELITGLLNINVEPQIHKYEAKKFIDWATHVEMEDTRKSGIKPFVTKWERIRKLEQENDALSIAVLELESLLLKQTA